jgi:hypothetical protein
MDCFYRANVGTGTTISASFRIDFVDITFRDSFHGAFIDAGSTSSAIIINFISHDLLSLSPEFQDELIKRFSLQRYGFY